jgi:histidinol dehydrogenase
LGANYRGNHVPNARAAPPGVPAPRRAVLTRLDLRGVPEGELASRLPRPDLATDEPVAAVRAVLAEVRAGGDEAVRRLTERFDGVVIEHARVDPEEIARARDQADPVLVAALGEAHDAIEAFHRTQLRDPHRHQRLGITVDAYDLAVGRAGLYVPGGRAAYPSSVLMTAVPARVAGVDQVVLCVPPDRETGRVAPPTLVAAAVAGVDEVYAIGGAQAIAAMAYGTETLAPVDVIVGPGNLYVALAKREVAGVVGVPSAFAGPSEIVVVADQTTPPTFAAIDVIVQAEHGPDGLAWLVTWSPEAADAIDAEITRLVATAPRRADIVANFARGGRLALVDGPAQAMAVANLIAPEHLQLMSDQPDALIPLVRNAGAVFCGVLAPASIGDYVAGPSHVLPTFGSARFASALTVDDFRKHLHVITVDQAGFDRVAPHVQTLAGVEGFDAHAQSIRLRRPEASRVGAERSRSEDGTRMGEAARREARRPEGRGS